MKARIASHQRFGVLGEINERTYTGLMSFYYLASDVTVSASRFQDTQTAGFIIQEIALILLCAVFGICHDQTCCIYNGVHTMRECFKTWNIVLAAG